MPPNSISLEELWQTCRGSENTFRYVSDQIGALVVALPEHRGYRIEGLAAGVAVAVNPLSDSGPRMPPPPPCPPACYTLSAADLADLMDGMAAKAAALAQVARRLGEQLERTGIKVPATVYASTLPGCFPGRDREVTR